MGAWLSVQNAFSAETAGGGPQPVPPVRDGGHEVEVDRAEGGRAEDAPERDAEGGVEDAANAGCWFPSLERQHSGDQSPCIVGFFGEAESPAGDAEHPQRKKKRRRRRRATRSCRDRPRVEN